MTTSIFEQASRQKLCFTTTKGLISVDDLWDLPLQSNTGKINLDDLAKAVNANLRESEVESFVAKNTKSSTTDRLRLDILKRVIEVRVADKEAAANQRENAERKRVLLEALAEKRVESLTNMTEAEIEAQLKALG